MKRFLCTVLVFLSLLPLFGCKDRDSHPVNFYYCEETISYDDGDAIIRAEQRKLSVPSNDIDKIVNLYLEGPKSTTLVSPFPAGTKLVNFSSGKQSLEIILSDEIASLTGVELTIACGCLASTVIALSQAETVVIRAETAQLGPQGYIELNAQSLQLIN